MTIYHERDNRGQPYLCEVTDTGEEFPLPGCFRRRSAKELAHAEDVMLRALAEIRNRAEADRARRMARDTGMEPFFDSLWTMKETTNE